MKPFGSNRDKKELFLNITALNIQSSGPGLIV